VIAKIGVANLKKFKVGGTPNDGYVFQNFRNSMLFAKSFLLLKICNS